MFYQNSSKYIFLGGTGNRGNRTFGETNIWDISVFGITNIRGNCVAFGPRGIRVFGETRTLGIRLF